MPYLDPVTSCEGACVKVPPDSLSDQFSVTLLTYFMWVSQLSDNVDAVGRWRDRDRETDWLFVVVAKEMNHKSLFTLKNLPFVEFRGGV